MLFGVLPHLLISAFMLAYFLLLQKSKIKHLRAVLDYVVEYIE